jgi:hypothetical protein
MKAFIDRFVYFNCAANRPGIRGKRAVVVIPYEENSLDTAAPVLDFFERSSRYLGVVLVGKLIVPGVTRRGEVRRNPACLQEARTLGGALT